jgi:adenylate cyclase
MSETRRKLTTIFSADVQDYSRLMGVDEEGTLTTLKSYRDTMAGLIEAHGGRVINTWGDGLIADFPSVVEAVRAAIDTQNELAGLNAARNADGRMLFRIGINLGDVMEVDNDIYGDGVNIAARLQTSAPPGGIVISSTVYDHVRNKLTVGFDFLGALSVKNISEGIPSYAVRIGDATGPAAGNAAMRGPAPSADVPQRPQPGEGADPLVMGLGRMTVVLAVIGAGLAAINLLSWHGEFWARWPIMGFAVITGLRWARHQRRFDRGLAALTVLGLLLVVINLMTWDGGFWAAWPLLALAIVAVLRRVKRL